MSLPPDPTEYVGVQRNDHIIRMPLLGAMIILLEYPAAVDIHISPSPQNHSLGQTRSALSHCCQVESEMGLCSQGVLR